MSPVDHWKFVLEIFPPVSSEVYRCYPCRHLDNEKVLSAQVHDQATQLKECQRDLHDINEFLLNELKVGCFAFSKEQAQAVQYKRKYAHRTCFCRHRLLCLQSLRISLLPARSVLRRQTLQMKSAAFPLEDTLP